MTPTRARLAAQAKVNLGLRVLGREPNGYHQLETLFARIDLSDDLVITRTASGCTLDCVGADVGPVGRNLAFRAARAYLEASSWATGLAIELTKRIPAGGGLGGGSADAGAVLRLLDAIAPTPLPQDTMASIALGLGADVPFLARTAPLALAWGRGEQLVPVAALPAREILLALPPFGVETKAAFGWLAETRTGSPVEPAAPVTAERVATWSSVAAWSRNDLEGPVEARHPSLAALREAMMAAGAEVARMSGSGSSVFGVFSGEAPAAVAGAPQGTRFVRGRIVGEVAPIEPLD
ncbi:MAG: 4-(cytidine 5'-diphospho)-2-C-methyl-D-erythritol kinase [Gemmatimonadota bacterium]